MKVNILPVKIQNMNIILFEHENHMCIKYQYLHYYHWHALNTPTYKYINYWI